MTAQPNRRPAGTPVGGQFAPSAHRRPSVELDAEAAIETIENSFDVPAAELPRWRQAGFSKAEARRWRISTEPDIGRGRVGPQEAKRWFDRGFRAFPAAAWREAGFDPERARSWATAGFEPHRGERRASDWESAGFAPDVANRWMTAGFGANEARRWRDAGQGYSTAASWADSGWQPDEARPGMPPFELEET